MRIVFTVVITIAILLILAVAFMYSGFYNVAASKGDNPLVRWVMSTIMEQSVKNHAHSEKQIKASGDFSGGFNKYTSTCVICHGSPIQTRWEPANSMVPKPPDLVKAANDWTLAELEWIIENGIKMTAMPAFGTSNSSAEILTLATFVDTLPSLTVSDYRRIADSLKNSLSPDTVNSKK